MKAIEETEVAAQPAADSASQHPQRRKSKRVRRLLLAMLAVLLIIIAVDLYAPRTSNLRQFDADEVARLETAMWRSYYQKERLRLFNQLTELLRTQYHMPPVRSHVVAYQAARAAFVFKDGHSRADYELALPYLVNFYEAIHKVSDTDFDVSQAAKLELEWWIVHRERKSHAPDDLVRALAELPAEMYRAPVEKLMEHARYRAEAMTIRDDRAEAGGVSDADWAKIEELLRDSWRSLHAAVNEGL